VRPQSFDTTHPEEDVDTVRTIQHWIDGRPAAGTSNRTGPVWNPATGDQQAEVLLADPVDLDDAVSAARRAFETWSQTSLSKRAKILFSFRQLVDARAQDLAEIMVFNRPLTQAEQLAIGLYLEQKYSLDTDYEPTPVQVSASAVVNCTLNLPSRPVSGRGRSTYANAGKRTVTDSSLSRSNSGRARSASSLIPGSLR
jgi:hypothetical protein